MRMLSTILSTLLLWCAVSSMLFAANRIAIFDYDLRTADDPGVGPYLQHKLKTWKPDIELKYISANGDSERAVTLLKELDSQRWDLIVTITTDAMLLARHQLIKTPFIFTNVNNPKVFGIEDRGGEGRNFSGASYYVPIKKQLQFFKRIQPGIERVGFLFDPSNRSMQAEAREARQACLDLAISFRYRRVNTDAELKEAADYLIKAGSDALIATSSGKIYMNMPVLLEVADNYGIPIYSFNARGVDGGAVAALSSNYWEMIDELVMPRIKAVIDGGQKVHELEIGYPKNHQMKVNEQSLERHGLIPPW